MPADDTVQMKCNGLNCIGGWPLEANQIRLDPEADTELRGGGAE